MRPMLAAKATEEILRKHLAQTYLLASPKLDGIRALVLNNQLVSRSLKPIRNKYVNALLSQEQFDGLDGELISGSPCSKDCFRKSTSAFMRFEGEPEFTYYVFDKHNNIGDFIHRYSHILPSGALGIHGEIHKLLQRSMASYEDILDYEEKCLSLGYEGVVLRRPDSLYKHNRSTAREGGMLKLKRFSDAEAQIISVEELFHNANRAEIDNLGLTKRSHIQDNKIPTGTMGSLVVQDLKTKITFRVGTGFNTSERKQFWQNRYEIAGTIIKYRSLPIGVKNKPRHPVYLGLRNSEDMD
mgnify:CR=1 FL=1